MRPYTHHVHSEGDRQVERVVGGFVEHDEVVPSMSSDLSYLGLQTERRMRIQVENSLLQGEPVQIHVILWSSQQVDQLSKFRLECGLSVSLVVPS
jgi:hypothetical protein